MPQRRALVPFLVAVVLVTPQNTATVLVGATATVAAQTCPEIDRLESEVRTFERDITEETHDYTKDEIKDAALAVAKDRLRGRPTAGALLDVRENLAKFERWAELQREQAVLFDQMWKCTVTPSPGCLDAAMKRFGTAYARYLDSLVNSGMRDVRERVGKANQIYRRFVSRALATAQTSALSAVRGCEAAFAERVLATETSGNGHTESGGGQGGGAGGGAGGRAAAWLGLLAGAVVVPLALMPEELFEEAGSTENPPSTPSGTTTTSGVSSFNGRYDLYYELFDVQSLGRRGFTLPGYITITNGQVSSPEINGTVTASGDVSIRIPCHDGGPTVVSATGRRTGTNVFEGTYLCVRVTYPWRIFNRR